MTLSANTDLNAVAAELELRPHQVSAVVALLDEENTVPFITRYRKDATGGLNEEQIRAIQERVNRLRMLNQRKQTILRSIDSQGKLNEELAAQIMAADTIRRLEDLYLPFKPKKQTLATTARERGLELLAREIFTADKAAADLDARAADFVNTDKGVSTAADALLGAGHILAERFSEHSDLRGKLRTIVEKTGRLVTAKASEDEKASAAYRDFFDYAEPLAKIPPHRVLAVNRGERDKVLRAKIDADAVALEQCVEETVVPAEHPHRELLLGCAKDALHRLVLPSLEREFRRELSDAAEEHAVSVFARNLRNLLLQAPVRGKRVLAVDPGFKRGCKVAVVDEFGNHLEHDLVHVLDKPEGRRQAAKQRLGDLVETHQCNVVAIGNGTACRETEALVAELIAERFADKEVAYVIVNEAGASVYSTSQVGRDEFPQFDATIRGAVSIGRRLQDPLSELVKIDPGSIGVGMYQHDVKARHLQASLDDVVESCVNYVGVNLNSASVSLLRYVSGLNQLTARRVYEFRQEHGPFKSREQLKEISGLGESAFVQSAGFLRIDDGENPLDSTWIHPESYPVARRVLESLGVPLDALSEKQAREQLASKTNELDVSGLAHELGVGTLTLRDIVTQLTRPGRDPREDLPKPLFKREILKLEHLQQGMELTGVVLNVVDFGAFVDVGLKDTGLVHISRLARGYVKDPHDVVAVGDIVRVWVLEVDRERRRVALTMLAPGTEKPTRPERPPRPERSERPPRPQGEGRPQSGGRPSHAKGRGRREHGRPPAHGGQAPPRPERPKKPLPPPKLTKAMKEGKEPLRSFRELFAFLDQPKEDQPKEEPGDGKKPEGGDNKG